MNRSTRFKLRKTLLRRCAFTVVELLVVIVVVGVLIGMLIPAVQSVRESARRASCQNNLRQVGVALLNFQSARRVFPEGMDIVGDRYASTWLVSILPYLEQQSVAQRVETDYRDIPFQFTWHEGFRTLIPLYQCPSDPASGRQQISHRNLIVTTSSYLGISGIDFESRDGTFFADSQVRASDFTDGLSNTVLVGERPPSPDYWYGWWYAGLGQDNRGSVDMVLGVRERLAPNAPFLGGCDPGPYTFGPGTNAQCDALHFWSWHGSGGNFLRADGSTALLAYSVRDLLPALATVNGNESAE